MDSMKTDNCKPESDIPTIFKKNSAINYYF